MELVLLGLPSDGAAGVCAVVRQHQEPSGAVWARLVAPHEKAAFHFAGIGAVRDRCSSVTKRVSPTWKLSIGPSVTQSPPRLFPAHNRLTSGSPASNPATPVISPTTQNRNDRRGGDPLSRQRPTQGGLAADGFCGSLMIGCASTRSTSIAGRPGT